MAVCQSAMKKSATKTTTTKPAMNLYSVCKNVAAPSRTLFETYFMAVKPSGKFITWFGGAEPGSRPAS